MHVRQPVSHAISSNICLEPWKLVGVLASQTCKEIMKPQEVVVQSVVSRAVKEWQLIFTGALQYG
jgi:hypothetical protein